MVLCFPYVLCTLVFFAHQSRRIGTKQTIKETLTKLKFCRLSMKDGNKPVCLVTKSQANRANDLEDMAVERFNNGYLGTSHVTGCE